MKLSGVSARKKYSNRNFFSKLLSALVLTGAVAFGLSLWQSGGALLSSGYKDSRFPIPDSRFFNFSGFITPAYAQACPLSDPTPPASGNGAIYYNSCVGKFRVYEGGSWNYLAGANLWTSGTGHEGLDIYNTATSEGDVYMGRGLIAGTITNAAAAFKLDLPAWNVIYGVAGMNSLATSNLLLLESYTGNTLFPRFAVRVDGRVTVGNNGIFVLGNKTSSDPTGVNGAMYYNSSNNKFRCYQAGIWQDCIGAGGGADTYWTLSLTRSGYIENTSPSNVFIKNNLKVARSITIERGGVGNADLWNVLTTSEQAPNSTALTAAAATADGTLQIYVGKAYSGKTYALMISNSLVTEIPQTGTGYDFTSVWVTNTNEVFALPGSPSSTKNLRQLVGNVWSNTIDWQSYNVGSGKKTLWGYLPDNPSLGGYRIFFNDGVTTSTTNRVFILAKGPNNWKTSTGSNLAVHGGNSSPNLPDVSVGLYGYRIGADNAGLYIIGSDLTAGAPAVVSLCKIEVNTLGSNNAPTGDNALVTGELCGSNLLGPAPDDFTTKINLKTVWTDTSGQRVVVAGSKRTDGNVLVSTTGGGSWQVLSLDADNVTFETSWGSGSGSNANIFLGGSSASGPVLYSSADGGVTWAPETLPPCSLSCTSGNYYVGFMGTSGDANGNVYTGVNGGELFWRGADIPSGRLDVGGDIIFDGDLKDEGGLNVWGAENQKNINITGINQACPDGYYVVGVDTGGGAITKLYCRQL